MKDELQESEDERERDPAPQNIVDVVQFGRMFHVKRKPCLTCKTR